MKATGFAGLSFLGAAMSLTASAAADAPPDCKAPAWAAQPPPGYHIGTCETRAFDALDLDLPAGSRKVSGRVASVTYELTEGAKDHTAADVRSFYVDAAAKAGATLMSNPQDGYNAILAKKSASGDQWMLYEHGSGNEESTGSFTLTTIDTGAMQREVVAQPMSGPLDVTPKTCVDPPWLKQQFAYFAIDRCERKIWDTVELDLPGGRKTVEGRHLSVTYKLTDEKKAPTALAVAKNYSDALQAIGAQLASSPRDSNHVVLTQQTDQGEVWYIYRHGSGNDQHTLSYTLDTVVVAPFPQEVVAQAMTSPMNATSAHCTDPPWLKKQFDYFALAGCGFRDIDQITLDLPGGKKTLAGRYLEATYKLTDTKRDPSALAVWKNYVNALQAIGAQLVSKPQDHNEAVLTQKTAAGELWYVYKHGSGNESSTTTYDLITVQVGGPPPLACTLEIYGVNFDFDKATLRPESEPVLRQVLALFTSDTAFSAEVGGHTDNIGKPDYNMKLSRERADAVKNWLVAHGVDAARVTANGYGDTQPLTPNTSDANRFKNRRVELKRKNCR